MTSGFSPGNRRQTFSGPTPAQMPPVQHPAHSGGNDVVIAEYDNYEGAQRAVDHLADHRFPVERVAIVGKDLRLFEQVRSRLTIGGAALAGAGSGAWFGALIGVLLAVFSVSAWWRVLFAAVAIGALWGAAFGAIAHAFTGGRRDFTSTTSLRAARYALTVEAGYADQAQRLLGEMSIR